MPPPLVTPQLLRAGQVLRTLEVNCGLWHGTMGVEEHGEVVFEVESQLKAGDLSSFLYTLPPPLSARLPLRQNPRWPSWQVPC